MKNNGKQVVVGVVFVGTAIVCAAICGVYFLFFWYGYC